ncbi:MAG: hypothetical protein AAGD05_19655, partial [Bacteroidota bacterium]
EGDGSRIMIIVDRAIGAIQGTTITGHGDHDSQIAPGSNFTLVDPNSTPLTISGNTATLYSAAGSHSLYYFLVGFEVHDSPNPCRPHVTGAILYTPNDYTLVDVLAPGGLWSNRYRPDLFKDNWQFKGNNRNKGKTPWAPWQGDRIEDMFNFLGDRFEGFDDNACLFCPYDCDFAFNVTTNKSCASTQTTESVTITSNLPNTPENIISDVMWIYDPIAFECIGCEEPNNFSPTFINHNLQNGTWPSNGKPIKVRFETADCGLQYLTKYIPSSNPDEIYISGFSSFDSGSPNDDQIRTFELVGADVGNVSNIVWSLGPNLTCVSGCYSGNPISIKPSDDAQDGETYIEARFSNSGQSGCRFKIRQKIT